MVPEDPEHDGSRTEGGAVKAGAPADEAGKLRRLTSTTSTDSNPSAPSSPSAWKMISRKASVRLSVWLG